MMRRKKDYLANLMFRTGFLRLLRFRTKSNCSVVCYHRIKERASRGNAFDDSVFGPSQDEFVQQLTWLKKNNDILSEGELLSVVRGEFTPPKRSVVLTFDDGYIDNYSLVFPVLKSFNVPAIFFIPTRSIEERSLGWWDLISYFIKSSDKNEIVFLGEKFSITHSFDKAIHYVLSLVYQNTHDVDELVKELSDSCEVDFPNIEVQGKELMTWEQIKEMSQNNVAIGSHTHTHTIMNSLETSAQKSELELSKQILEGKLGVPVRSMSYPCGNYNNFSPSTKTLVTEAGYELAFSFLTGINSMSSLDPMDVKRVVTSNYFPSFVSIFEFPELFLDSHDSTLEGGGLYG